MERQPGCKPPTGGNLNPSGPSSALLSFLLLLMVNDGIADIGRSCLPALPALLPLSLERAAGRAAAVLGRCRRRSCRRHAPPLSAVVALPPAEAERRLLRMLLRMLLLLLLLLELAGR